MAAKQLANALHEVPKWQLAVAGVAAIGVAGLTYAVFSKSSKPRSSKKVLFLSFSLFFCNVLTNQ
jgi:hypothetical protein